MSNQSVLRTVAACGTSQPNNNQNRISHWSNFSLFRLHGITGQKALRAIVQLFPDAPAEDRGGHQSQEAAGCNAKDVNHLELLRRARLWNHKASVNDALWEAAVRHFGNLSATSCFLMEVDKGCPQPPVFDDSAFGEYSGTLVQNEDGPENRRQSTPLSSDFQESMVEFVL